MLRWQIHANAVKEQLQEPLMRTNRKSTFASPASGDDIFRQGPPNTANRTSQARLSRHTHETGLHLANTLSKEMLARRER
jgi:hypothetical protein